MLEVYAQNLSVTPNTALVFSNKALQTNTTATLGSGNNSISLNAPGFYQVTFSAYGASTTADSAIGVQLVANGAAVANASSSTTTASSTAPQVIGFSTIVNVEPALPGNTATIAVNATGTAGVLTMADLVVHRIP